MLRTCTALLAFALAFSLAACSSSDESGEAGGGNPWSRQGPATIPSVEVVKSQYGALPLEHRMSGTVRAENQVAIYPEISAPVTRVAVRTGAYVEAGQGLVYLRNTQFDEQVQQAEAALQIARAEAKRAEATLRELEARLDRTQRLADRQFQSEQELQALQAQVDGAQATLEQSQGRVAQAQATLNEQQETLRRTVIRAPISGYVGQRNVEIGQRVDPNTQLFVIGNLDEVRVDVAIPDEMVGQIQEGQTALISAPSLGDEPVRAQVSRISPFLETGSFSAAAEIDVDNAEGRLRPGMFVTVDVLYGESRQATLVPTSALYEDPNSGALGVVTAPSLGMEIPVEEPTSFDSDNPPPILEATPMVFQEVDVLARGEDLIGIDGVAPGTWVVTVGQELLDNIASERVQARARPLPWSRVVALQQLQDQDLLRQFMEKQQRVSRQLFEEQADEPVVAGDTTASSRVVQTSAPISE